MCIGNRDVVPDGGLEGSDAGMHAPAQLAFGEQREPALHQIDPGGAGGREVQMEARPLQQPLADQGRFMRAIVVEDQMHVQLCGDRRLNRVEELPELSRPMPLMELPNDAAGFDFQGGEERGRAMAMVVMGPTLNLSRAHRQQGARAVQGLNLGFLIHAQDQRFVGGMQVEPHNITHLLNKQRVGRQLERLGAVRLQAEGPPDALHRTPAHPARLRHSAGAPMRRVGGRRLQSLGDNPFHGRIRHRAWGTGAGLIQQPIEAVDEKALPPFADRLRRHTDGTGDGEIRLPLGTGQNNPGPLRQRLSGFRAARPLLQGLSFGRRQGQRSCRSSSSHGVLPSIPEDTSDAQLIPRTSETGH